MAAHAVASPHALATAAGERALAAGGTAVDAALAAAAVLTVVYPHNCALGGDLWAVLREPGGEAVAVDASGPAGAAADAAALRRHGEAMPVTGAATVTVPGLVAGWAALHARGARRPWAAVLADAEALAADGVPVARSLAAAIAETPLDDPGMAAVLAPGGTRLRAGDVLRQPALARTLATLAADGPRALYEGEVAARLVAAVAERGGALREADLRAYDAALRAPLRGRSGGLELLTSPPASSGVLLLQALAALEATGAGDPLGADAGVLAHVLRLGAEARDRLLGDGADPAAFLAPEVVAEVARAARAAAPAAGAAGPPRPGGDTVAVVAVDAEGRAVALVQSLFHGFGARILEPRTGVLLHNRGASFSLRDGHPNLLAPGRRPAHTLLPVVVERAGRLQGVLGTMGGRAHAQVLAQVLLRLLGGASPQEAVAAPRWVVGAVEAGERGGVTRVERGVAPAARASLERAGLRPVDVGEASEWVGHAQAVWLDPDPRAGTDPRADG